MIDDAEPMAGPGIYWVTAKASPTQADGDDLDSVVQEGGHPGWAAIPRARRKADDCGVLYLGRTNGGADKACPRFSDLMDGFSGDWRRKPRGTCPHQAASEYYRSGLAEVYRPETLEFWFWPTSPAVDGMFAYDCLYYEDALLVNYRDALGEYPPLNIAPATWNRYRSVPQRRGGGQICAPTWDEMDRAGTGLQFGWRFYAPQQLVGADLNLTDL